MMDQEDFTRAFVTALKNVTVVKALRESICGELVQQVQHLREVVKNRDKQISDLKQQLAVMETKTDDLEQYSRRNSVRVDGIPENQNEDPMEVALELINSHMKIENISIGDIDRVHRVGRREMNNHSSSKPRAVLIKFATYRARNLVYKTRAALKQNKFKNSSIFLNEDLTQCKATLLYKARQLKKKNIIADCWSYDGRILIKNSHGIIKTIKEEKDLPSVP